MSTYKNVMTCYTGYSTYFIFPTFPPFFIFDTVQILLHPSISFHFLLSSFRSFHYVPDTSIGFLRCCLLIWTLIYIVQ
ncbi:hypothetical protein J3R30DRAFT_3444807 [Lentinula aciculospora]|uniref:Uncharacterized protein n=1 Tax=Lentinula aciculospora TaxID=153920 RepID=A0A9W9ANR7_9AGAR|nr:hypothetical protein J3R30DRAFT_3444807 [Lentinula aciculospora]